jgi:hypothetical protein
LKRQTPSPKGFMHTTITSGEYAINNISTVSPEFWDIQLYYKPLDVKKGETYYFSFDAHADADRDIHIYIGEDGGNSHPFLSEIVKLANSVGNYQFAFTIDSTLGNPVKMAFEVGKSQVPVYFDNLVISKVNNTIRNGDFQTPLIDPFTVYQADWAGVTFKAAITEGELGITNISKASAEAWKVQLIYAPINIYADSTYKLKFDAHSPADRPVHVFVGSFDGSVKYWDDNATITSETHAFEYTFKMNNATDDSAKISLELGTSDVDAFFDNISLEKVKTIADNIENASNLSDLQIYPNPASDRLNIKLMNNANGKVAIYDINGRMINSHVLKDNLTSIRVNELKQGMYFLTITTETGIYNRKVLIK